jgi:hypothetical protein
MKLNRASWLMVVGLVASPLAQAIAPVVIKTYAQHVGGNIVYTHQVTNTGTRDIGSFSIGEDTDMVDVDIPYYKDQGELTAMPLGSAEYFASGDVLPLPGDVLPSSVSGLSGWTAQVIQIEDSGLFMQWYSPSSPLLPDIRPGQTATFSVTVPKPSAAYLTGHFSAQLGGTGVWKYNDVMQKLDVTPPVLSVSLSPYSIPFGQRGQIVPITATITVSDDYDPAPDIQLVSITANEALVAAVDVQGAVVNTDDRSFSLNAAHTTTAVARIYTVTYSATDASGNKSTATATVTAF